MFNIIHLPLYSISFFILKPSQQSTIHFAPHSTSGKHWLLASTCVRVQLLSLSLLTMAQCPQCYTGTCARHRRQDHGRSAVAMPAGAQQTLQKMYDKLVGTQLSKLQAAAARDPSLASAEQFRQQLDASRERAIRKSAATKRPNASASSSAAAGSGLNPQAFAAIAADDSADDSASDSDDRRARKKKKSKKSKKERKSRKDKEKADRKHRRKHRKRSRSASDSSDSEADSRDSGSESRDSVSDASESDGGRRRSSSSRKRSRHKNSKKSSSSSKRRRRDSE